MSGEHSKNPKITAAEQALSSILGHHVRIDVESSITESPDDGIQSDSTLKINIEGITDASINTAQVVENIRGKLKAIPAIHDNVVLETQAEEVAVIKKTLAELVKDTNLPPSLVDWSGFKHRSYDWNMSSHLSGLGATFRLNIDVPDEQMKAKAQEIDALIEKNKPQILQNMADNIIRILGNPANAEEIRTKIKNLNIKAHVVDGYGTTGVEIVIRSPEQENELKKCKDENIDVSDEIRLTNPLSLLTSAISDEVRSKTPNAISQLDELFISSVMSINELKPIVSVVSNQPLLVHFLQQEAKSLSPEKQALVAKIIADPYFTKDDWRLKEVNKPASISFSAVQDTLTANIGLITQEKLNAIIDGLAEMAPQVATVEQTAKDGDCCEHAANNNSPSPVINNIGGLVLLNYGTIQKVENEPSGRAA